ncbi:MAG: permease-like cell division protein FtsX [Candidatus Zixiibacteriota bacterium]
MLRIKHVAREIGRNLIRYPGTSIGSFLSLALIFLLFDLFWVGAKSADKIYSGLMTQVRMESFIDESVPDSTLAQLAGAVSDINGIAGVQYVSKDDARNELTRMTGTDLLVGYDTLNPLPRSLLITLEPESVNGATMTSIEDSLRGINGIIDVQYSRTWVSKAEATKSLIWRLGLGLGAIILLTAVIISTNSIRLMTRARGTGIRQLQLLGAGGFFIAMPYLLEGFLIGGLSAVAGWGAIIYGRNHIDISQFEVLLPSQGQIALFCCGTALLGLLSGLLGLRRLLR